MADEIKQPDSAGGFISEVRRGIRQELEHEYSRRLLAAREEIRKAQDLADAQKICASREQEQMAARMAEYRRGKWYHLGAILASAASGLGLGYLAQKNLDVRLRGVPVLSIAGFPGVAFGVFLDEGMAARASLAVGGTMFAVGTYTYVMFHPLPPEEKVV